GEAGYGQADVYTDATGASSLISGASKKRIVSARIALLLSSASVVSTDTAALPASSIDVLDKTYEEGAGDSNVNLRDGRLYRVFSTTVTIRNQVDQI
ncbi:MAG: PilW family protein, partial [Pseudomonadota bacterium]